VQLFALAHDGRVSVCSTSGKLVAGFAGSIARLRFGEFVCVCVVLSYQVAFDACRIIFFNACTSVPDYEAGACLFAPAA